LAVSGGRNWWAHRAFARMNTGPTMLCNQIEDLMEILGFGRFSGQSSQNAIQGLSPTVSEGR